MNELIRRIKEQKNFLMAVGILLLILAVLMVSLGRKARSVPASAGITNWGLSFQAEGAVPVGNASQEYLSGYGALYYMPGAGKTVYITFDAGYENGNTEKILDALKAHGVKAVFFLVGNYLETQPELVKRMAEEGHTVGNHTYSHPDMSAIADRASFKAELERNEALYKEITGSEMAKLYRPPQGKFCEENLKMAKELGYRTVFWSLAYVDWYKDDQPTKEEAFSKLLPRVHDGAVVLLHSTSDTNGAILDELLTKWENMGYSFGDLQEALEKEPG